MVLQRTFEVSHLKDYLRSAEGIHRMFEQLGYDVYDPEPLDADDIDMSEADAQHVQAVYLINGMDFGHTVWLFEVDDTTTVRLRGLAYDVLQRAGTHTLVVTKDYREIIIAHPYFVGGTSKSHTRVNKLKIDSRNPTRHDVDTINALLARDRKPEEIYKSQDDAFNVNRVTNKFYREYRDYFHRVQEVVIAWNKGIAEFQNSDQRDKLHAFVQRLMGRLMFLYFLQRKGWLGGRSDFLTWQYRQMVNRHAGELSDKSSYYYREVLEPLFFDTLNKKRPENWTQWGVEIPYLNGGLFDRSRDPDGMIVLPDALFDPNSNTGLLAFFNRYNFTITDDAPMEQDVAVDPEMLGKVFENMLEEEDRGQSGSFYTPRTIVSYMCQEALAGYLEESAGIPREEMRRHFDPDDDITFTEEQAQEVSNALDTLTVLDPAVGSGSFLIGMLNEIITLRHRVAAALNQTVTPELIAEWKEAIIRDTLYGVDIKPGAIEIAQLRLWLSLVVNQTMADAKPLPNLDYKLMAGNSLIETIDGEPILTTNAQNMLNSAAQPQQLNMFTTAAEENRKLEDLRDEYFHATPEARKLLAADIRFQERRIIEAGLNDMLETVQQRISQIEKKYQLEGIQWKNADAKKYAELLAKAERLNTIKRDLWDDEATLPFFLYRLHFNDVFARKGGFDVVIGNPPYVEFKNLDASVKNQLTDYVTTKGKYDLYVPFIERAGYLIAPDGNISYICPTRFLQRDYGSELRKHIYEQYQIVEIVDFGDIQIFDGATNYTGIFSLNKRKGDIEPAFYKRFISSNASEEVLIDVLRQPEHQTDVIDVISIDSKVLEQPAWYFHTSRTLSLLTKLQNDSLTLSKLSQGIYQGIATGKDSVFIVTEDVVREYQLEQEMLQPMLKGKDISRFRINWKGTFVVYPYDQHGDVISEGVLAEQYPQVYRYLVEKRPELSGRGYFDKSTKNWYELWNQRNLNRFYRTKIITLDNARENSFVLDTRNYLGTTTVYSIVLKDESLKNYLYVLGILNSSTLQFYHQNNTIPQANGFYRYQKLFIEALPFPQPNNDLRGKIASLVQQCLDAAKDDPDKLPALEAELNQLVYQAYGLDADDIRVIEGHLSGAAAGSVDADDLDGDED